MGAIFSFLFRKKPPRFQPCPDKTVLIIGGGMAGLSAIYALRQLDSSVNIVVVDPKEYSEILWAAYRSPFEPWVAKGSLILLNKYCEAYNVKHIQATVTKLDSNSCKATMLGDAAGTTCVDLKFDACVIATGANAPWKGMGRDLPKLPSTATAEHRLAQMQAQGDLLLNANHVVIVGGVLIGTELAGDLAAYSDQKAGCTKKTKVTLIHSGPTLCHTIMSPPAAAKLQQMLEKLGVVIRLDEKAKEENNGKVVLLNSNDVEEEILDNVDVVIKTTGFTPVNDFLRSSTLFAEALDERGWIKTDEHFVVSGTSSSSHNHVFAFGDCSLTLPNAANVYMRTANVLAHNIKTVLATAENKTTMTTSVQMKKFQLPFAGYCNTAGPNQGIFYSSAFWTRYLLPWLKNKTMFFMSPQDMIGVKKEMTLLSE